MPFRKKAGAECTRRACNRLPSRYSVAMSSSRAISSYIEGLPCLLDSFWRKSSCCWSRSLQRGMLPCLAIRLGCRRELEALYRLQERGDCANDDRVSFSGALEEAAMCGDMPALKWLLAQPRLNHYWPPRLMNVAIAHGHLPKTQWLLSSHTDLCTEIASDAVDSAAQALRIELFEWIHQLRLHPFTPTAIVLAARTGNVSSLRVLCECYKLVCRSEELAAAVDGDNCEAIVFVAVNGMVDDLIRFVEIVYESGNHHVARTLVRELSDHRYQSSRADLRASAAMVGDTTLLTDLLRDGDSQCIQRAAIVAAKYGHMDVIQAVSPLLGSSVPECVFNTAVRWNRCEMVKYFVHELGVQCPETALHLAAAQGSTDMARFLALQTNSGCFFHARRLAARGQQQEVVDFLTTIIDRSVRYCEPKLHHTSSTRRCQLKMNRWTLLRPMRHRLSRLLTNA